MREDKRDIERISAEIQLYFHKYPNAADTLEGITKWWLTRQRYEEGKENVQKALYLLIEKKILTRTVNLDGTYHYKRIEEGYF